MNYMQDFSKIHLFLTEPLPFYLRLTIQNGDAILCITKIK